MPLPMPIRRRSVLSTDLSAFMTVVLMLAGCLIVLLIVNLAARLADPNLIVIGTVIRAPGYQQGSNTDARSTGRVITGNFDKKPIYLDVHPDKLIFLPGGRSMPVRGMDRPTGLLETMLARIEPKRDGEYVLLLVRPRTAAIVRKLKQSILARGIDVGMELYDDYETVHVENTIRQHVGGGG